MRESPGQHNDVVEILTAFVRSRVPYSRWLKQEQADTAQLTEVSPDMREGFDVQSALTALARRPRRTELVRFNLSNTNLRGAFLFEADLRSAVLDSTDLSGAFLTGADLSYASLADAKLCGAHLEKTDAEPYFIVSSNKEVSRDFTRDVVRETPRRKLAGANLANTDLANTDLSGANLIGADLSGANLIGAKLGAKLREVNLSCALLSGVDLSGMDLSGADLRNAKLNRANLSGANISNVDWSGASLDGVLLDPTTEPPDGWRRDPRLGDGLVRVDGRAGSVPSPRLRGMLRPRRR